MDRQNLEAAYIIDDYMIIDYIKQTNFYHHL